MNIFLYGILLSGCELFSYLNIDFLLPIVKDVAININAPLWWQYWIFTSWVFAFSLTSIAVAIINTKLTRSFLALCAAISFLVGSIGFVLSNNPIILLICRIIQGVATSLILIVGCAFLHDTLPTLKVIRTLSWVKSFTVTPILFAPIISTSWVSFGFHWKGLFWINTIIGSIFFFGLFFLLKSMIQSNLLKTSKGKSLKDIQKSIFSKRFFGNVFTQNSLEIPFYLWLTFAPVHCEKFIIHHTIVLCFSLLGMGTSALFSKIFDVNKALTVCVQMGGILSSIFLSIFLFRMDSWEYLFIPTCVFSLLYGIQMPIMDRSIAISIDGQDKTITLGCTYFINNFVYSCVIGLSSIFVDGSGIKILTIMTVCLIISCFLDSDREKTITY